MIELPTVEMGQRESGGVLLGQRLPQWILIGFGLFFVTQLVKGAGPVGDLTAAAGVPSEVSTVLGHVVWLPAVVVCFAIAWTPVRGRYLDQYVPVVANFLWQRATGQDVYRGGVFRMIAKDEELPGLELPGDLAHLQLLTYEVGDVGEIAVVKDPRERSYTAVLACQGRQFELGASEQKAARMNAFGQLLTERCTEGGLVKRIQVLERTESDNGESMARDFAVAGRHARGGGDFATDSYAELIESMAQSQQSHEVFVALTIDAGRAAQEIRLAGGGDQGATAVMMRELDGLADALGRCGVEVEGWCPPRALGFIIRTAYDPELRSMIERRGGAESDLAGGAEGLPSGVAPEAAGPMRAENYWDRYVTDSAEHRTWWVAQWPRRAVDGGFLRPLLLATQCRRTVSLVFEPMSTARAKRRIETKQASLEGEGLLRGRIGRRTTGRDRREVEQATRREEELLDGYGIVRMIGLVSTSAPDRATLDRQSVEIESQAGLCSLELARLYGEQDQGFACAALPLGRGLR